MALACLRQWCTSWREPEPEPAEAPLREPAELLDEYAAGNQHLRLNLYLQHRDLRHLFADLERTERE